MNEDNKTYTKTKTLVLDMAENSMFDKANDLADKGLKYQTIISAHEKFFDVSTNRRTNL